MQEEVIEGLGGARREADDWALAEARRRYGDADITREDLWHYVYGVMHAPDWRERFAAELENSAPRFPWATDFYAFRDAGWELMEMHAAYDRVPEHPVPCLETEEGADLRIPPQGMKWAKKATDGGRREVDLTRLIINEKAVLYDIPLKAHAYQVAGLSPLQWAVKNLKAGKEPGEDPNCDPLWHGDESGLVSHLRRLTYVGVRTAEICEDLPPSLDEYEEE